MAVNNSLGDIVINGKVDLNTTEAREQLGVLTRSYKQLVNTKNGVLTKEFKQFTKTLSDGSKQITTLNKYTNEFGRSVTSTGKALRDANGQISKTLKNSEYIVTSQKKVNKALKETEETMKSMQTSTKKVKSVLQDFSATFLKMAKFNTINLIYDKFVDIIKESIQVVKEFDEAQTEFKKVSELSGKALDDYAEKLGKLGTAVAKTRTEMVQASTEFKKSGYSDEDSAELAQIAMLYSNIADAELSAGESASYIISQMKAFGYKTAQEAQSIIDKTNEVSNTFAVSSSDISSALTKTSSAMSAYGNDINETIALVTAGTEILSGNAGKVSRGLRSIGANIVKLANDNDTLAITVNGITKNIQLVDQATGEMLDTYEVLQQIAGYWDEMTQAEKSNLALTLGMKTQIEVFTSVVGNFESAEKALTTAIESEGSAWRENEKYMESIKARTQELNAQFQEFALGDGGLAVIIKNVISFNTALLKVLNTPVGKWFTYLSTAITSTILVMKLMPATISSKVIPQFTNLITIIKETIASMSTLQIVATAGIGAIVIALGVLISKLVVTKKEAKELQEEFSNQIAESTEEIKSLNDELDEYTKKLEEAQLAKAQLESGGVTNEEKARIALLDAEIGKYETELRLVKERIEAEETNRKNALKDKYNTKVTSNVADEGANESVSDVIIEKTGSVSSIFDEQIKDAYQIVDKLKEYSDIQKNITDMSSGAIPMDASYYERYADSIEETQEKSASYKQTLDDLRASMLDNYQIIQDNIDAGNEVSEQDRANAEAYLELINVIDMLNSKSEESIDIIGLTAEAYGLSRDELVAYQNEHEEFEDDIVACAEALAQEKEELEGIDEAFADSLKSITEVSDAYDALSSAIEEYNETGQLSAKTMTGLVEKYPDYLQYLVDENGQLAINEDGMLALANARIDDAEALAYRQAMAELDTIAMQDNNTEVENSEGASQTFKSATTSDINELNKIIQALNDGTYAWQRYNFEKTQGMTTYQKSQYEGVMNNLADQIKVLEKARNSLGSYSKSTSKAGSSSSKASKEVDKLTESINNLESEIKKFEDTIKYIDGKFDDVIDDLKDAKDKVLDGIDEQIDAIKDLADEADDAYEAQITALENKRDAELAIIDEEISALEDENDALQRQYELQELLDNLAKAKSSKVKLYQNGSFGYSQNVEEVAGAQNELSEWTTKQALQAKIDALNNYRDTVVANYKQQISAIEQLQASTKASYEKQVKDLENYKDAMEKQYDAQIENWENQKKEFNTLVDSYETEQNRLQALELTGIDFENESWKTRIGNLSNFVTTYTNLLKQLADAKKAEASGGDVSVSSGASYSGSSSSSVSTTTTSTTKALPKVATTGKAKIINNAKKKGMTSYASGSSYIKADQMAIVGEDPYREIVIGSKLNNGVVTNLQKGSGVIPSTTTSKLIEMANASYYGGSNHTLNDVTNNGGETINMNIDNVQVRANNADEFVASMKEFKLGMTQKAYTR